jgi:hypothetical protein
MFDITFTNSSWFDERVIYEDSMITIFHRIYIKYPKGSPYYMSKVNIVFMKWVKVFDGVIS